MKIVLINPPWYSSVPVKFQTTNLGLSYITAFVQQRGHTVVPIDALFETPDIPVEIVPVQLKYQNPYRMGISYENIVKQIPPDTGLIGIAGPTYNHAQIIRELGAAIKQKYPKIPIIVGGPYPSAIPEDIPSLNVDFGINGEPEMVLEKFLAGVSHDKIPGLIYNDGKEWRFNGKAELPEDLDSIPFPAREVFHCNEILDQNVDGIQRRREGSKIVSKKIREVTMVLSRGCPYSCGFCSISLMNSKKWRWRSPENVIAEMLELRDSYKVEEVTFMDDHLLGNRERFMRIMDMMINKKVGLRWSLPNGVRIDYLDRAIMQKMKDSGCSLLILGIQHGSQRMLEIMDTKLDLRKVEPVIHDATKIGLNIGAFLVVGYPGETREYFMEAVKFYKYLGRKYGLKNWNVNIARGFPKTPLDILCREKGYYVRKDVENLLYFFPGDGTEANIKTVEFDPEEVYWRRDYAVKEFTAVENPLYWNTVHLLEHLKLKEGMRKIMPESVWDTQKKIMYNLCKKVEEGISS